MNLNIDNNRNNDENLHIPYSDSWKHLVNQTNDFFDSIWMIPKSIKWWSAGIMLFVVGLIIGMMCFVPSPYNDNQPFIFHFISQEPFLNNNATATFHKTPVDVAREDSIRQAKEIERDHALWAKAHRERNAYIDHRPR